MQLIKWFREAFDLPVLSVEEVDAQIAGQPSNLKSDHKGNILLSDVIAELSASDRSPLVQEE